jgi:7,8-dihydropterin-6-yl-methyl-4-(beta-D-ribofuranosyl)aminobenzene 5'-phosphate synthase
VAQRPPVAYDMWERGRGQLIAEHGLSLLLTVERGGRSASLIYDAGLSREAAIHNMDVLEVRLPDLRAIVVSHGHTDHHGGLEGMVRRVGVKSMPIVIHPEAWRERKVVFPTGAELHLPPPSRQDLDREGVEVTEERQPSLLIDGTVLVTGQVERVTDFEKGFPLNYARSNGSWEPDPWVWDDQAVVVNLKGKGLVVLSGCSHSGTINVVRQAQRLTGEDRVHAFVGGMHLTGGIFERLIPETLNELAAIAPRWLVPGHCTGWKATHEIARRLPEAYVQTSVGTRLRFA